MFNSKRLKFKKLRLKDVTKNYVDWLNDKKINKFLEARFQKHNIKNTKKYVKQINQSIDSLLFGIFLKKNNKHIGNIKIDSIDLNNKRAFIGIMIGEVSYWGQGFATEAIISTTKYSFQKLGLKKLMASCHIDNTASKKIFINSGFKIEGKFKKDANLNGKMVDTLWLGKIINE